MRPDVQAVQDFLSVNARYARLDVDVLVNVVKSLEDSERKLLLADVDDMDSDVGERYNFLMQKIFNRHNDTVAGFTKLVVCGTGVNVVCSAKSNVSEFAHSLADYEVLKEHGLEMIGDVRTSTDESEEVKHILEEIDVEKVILCKE